MIRYIIVSIVSGILFGVMDGLINANPVAQRLYDSLKPVAKTSVNVPAGIVIDLVYGFVMAGIFLLLYKSIPGESGFIKGLGFGFMVWFFRVVMSAATQWMTLNLSISAIIYTLLTGLGEMLILGIIFGFALKPSELSIS